MTTDKIRAAAQALHDAATPDTQRGLYGKFNVSRTDGSDHKGGKHYGCDYFVLDVTHDKHAPAALSAYASSVAATHPQLAADMRSRWGLAEPAQAAPADDAVQVVAWLHGVVHAESAEPDEALSFSPDNFPMHGLFRSVCQDALVCQRDHLAAMEALRQEIAYHEAQDGLLSTAQDEVARLRSELAEVKRPLDAQMARLNENLITANEQAAALRQEVERLRGLLDAEQNAQRGLGAMFAQKCDEVQEMCADRSAQVAELMRKVMAAQVQAFAFGKSGNDSMEAGAAGFSAAIEIEDSIRKLAGGA